MSSSGRQKKVGLQRIDAAYDALIPFGFSKEQIRSTIKNLLEVYGGSSGWIFIEEASYKLVIDTILEQQEDGETENMEADEHVPDAVEESQETSLLAAITSTTQDHDNLDLPDEHGVTEPEDMQSVNKVISDRDDVCKRPRVMQCSRAVVNIGSSYTQQLNKEPASAFTIESSSSKKPIEEPARKRPPCYGCFSETESDSGDEL